MIPSVLLTHFNQQILSAFYVSGTVLGTEQKAVMKEAKLIAL